MRVSGLRSFGRGGKGDAVPVVVEASRCAAVNGFDLPRSLKINEGIVLRSDVGIQRELITDEMDGGELDLAAGRAKGGIGRGNADADAAGVEDAAMGRSMGEVDFDTSVFVLVVFLKGDRRFASIDERVHTGCSEGNFGHEDQMCGASLRGEGGVKFSGLLIESRSNLGCAYCNLRDGNFIPVRIEMWREGQAVLRSIDIDAQQAVDRRVQEARRRPRLLGDGFHLGMPDVAGSDLVHMTQGI